MAKPPRISWDSSYFIAWVDRATTEDVTVLQAVDVTIERMIRGRIRVVASRVIETEVRPGSVDYTKRFHEQLRACPYFESFGESPAVRSLAASLPDRLQATGRRGGYADLVHLATAIAARATEFWTTDSKILKWAEAGITTEITICRPYLVQGVLDLSV